MIDAVADTNIPVIVGGVDVIVSGHDDFLVLSPFGGIAIVVPADFLAMLD